jgi:hypothetical protein
MKIWIVIDDNNRSALGKPFYEMYQVFLDRNNAKERAVKLGMPSTMNITKDIGMATAFMSGDIAVKVLCTETKG